MMDESLRPLVNQVLNACRAAGVTLATAESCTGGLIAATLTDVPGASDVVDRGFVTYSNDAKLDLLGVMPDLLAHHGAVSEEVARAMAEGALRRAGVGVAIAVTGIAGPGGATPTKPVGRVHLACAARSRPTLHRMQDYGDIGRTAVRRATLVDALNLVLEQIRD